MYVQFDVVTKFIQAMITLFLHIYVDLHFKQAMTNGECTFDDDAFSSTHSHTHTTSPHTHITSPHTHTTSPHTHVQTPSILSP